MAPGLAWAAAALVGALLGLSGYTFLYAAGLSYFSADPRACVNCHIMREHFDAWQKASHHAAAVCVECHLPRAGVGKWLAKAENGFWHSKGFTFQDFPEPIRIKPRNLAILQANCVECHRGLVGDILPDAHGGSGEVRCVVCHGQVGHGPPR